MNKPLVVCALSDELKIKSPKVDFLYTGVGKINAAISMTEFLCKNPLPPYVINFGTAGSKKIPVGSLVDCTKFIQRDMDATPMGFKIGETPFEEEPSMVDFSHIKNPIGLNTFCYTGDTFETNISQYDDVVDMEAYALAKTCRNLGKDFVSYKYISDDGNADDWEKNCGKGVKEFKKLLNEIL